MPYHLTGFQPTFIQKYLKNELIQYAFIMVLVLIVFFIFSSTGIYEKFIHQPISVLFASGSAGILKLFGYESSSEDINIHCGAAVVSISKGCDAIAPIFLSSLAISLFPKVNLQNKINGILLVVLVLGILNLIRILSLVFSQLYFPEIFDFLHILRWLPGATRPTLVLLRPPETARSRSAPGALGQIGLVEIGPGEVVSAPRWLAPTPASRNAETFDLAPDGTRAVFSTARDGRSQIYLVEGLLAAGRQ